MPLKDDLEKLDQYREQGDQKSVANILVRIGATQLKKDEPEEALASFQEAYSICKVMDNKAGQAEVLLRVIKTLTKLKRFDEAEQGGAVGLALCDQLHNLGLKASLLEALAQAAQAAGQIDRAVDLLLQADRIFLEHDDPYGHFFMIEQLAPLYQASGRLEDRLAAFRTMVDLADEAKDRFRLGMSLVGEGQALIDLDRPEEAVEPWTLALRLFTAIGQKQAAERIAAQLDKLKTALEQLTQGN